jgi:hypothetical protein
MDCSRFEDQISDYLDGALHSNDATLFREHSLQCRACRSLFDEVKGALHDCKMDDEFETSSGLESALLTIACEDAGFGCHAFEEQITEFLDGFVPAPVYHRFEEHASECSKCSGLLTDVVYAVASCHSVHTYEEVEAPESLFDKLNAIARKKVARRTASSRITAFAARLMPRATSRPALDFCDCRIACVSPHSLFLSFSGFQYDRTVAGIYRQAHVKFGQLYSQGADIYSQKDELAARIERVGHGIEEIWDSLGGATEKDNKHNRNSSSKAEGAEKN